MRDLGTEPNHDFAVCRLRCAVMVLSAFAMTGCALVYSDDEGGRHIVGLVDIEIRQPIDPVTIAGDVVDVTIFGLGIYNTREHAGLLVGYSREVSAAVRNNVYVVGNPIHAIQSGNESRTSCATMNAEVEK